MKKIYKPKKLTPRKLQDKLWEECRRLIKAEYGNTCFTCGKCNLEGSGWQIGHFIAKGACGANLKYDLRNLRPQCFHCNINLGGNQAYFYKRLVETKGQEYVDKIFQDKNLIVKSYDHYEYLLNHYKSL